MKRVEGNPNVPLLECTSPVKGLWRVRWDIQTTDSNSTYMEEQFNHKPTVEEIKAIVLEYYNDMIDSDILSGFRYEGAMVWLSAENQFNYKAAYDLAVQTNGENLPAVFKFGTNEEPYYRTFETLEDLRAFYFAAMGYVQTTLQEGWARKDAFDIQLYQ